MVSASSIALFPLALPFLPLFSFPSLLQKYHCAPCELAIRADIPPKFHRTDLPAPEIAKDYWRLGPDAKFVDVVYAVRSDESTHRFVNHSLASLKYEADINPFALQEPDMTTKGSRIW